MQSTATPRTRAGIKRLGLIGNGHLDRARDASSRLPDGVAITALVQSGVPLGRSRGATGPAIYATVEDMLADARIDAALVMSALPQRSAHALACVRAAKHVLADLPLAPDLPTLDAILDASAASGVVCIPAFTRRFRPEFVHAARAVQDGRLGRLLQVRCDWTFRGANDGQDGWRATYEECAAHTVDLCRWWLGDVETVSGDVEEARAARDGSCVANLILNHARGTSVHHISRSPRNRLVEQYRLDGADGTLEMVSETAAPDSADTGWTGLLAHFADRARSGVDAGPAAHDGRAAVEVLQAAYLSTAERMKVSLPLAAVPIPAALRLSR